MGVRVVGRGRGSGELRRRQLSPTMGLALSLVYPELSSFTSGTRGWSRE